MTIRSRGVLLALAGALCLTPDGLLVRLADRDDWTILFWRGLIITSTIFLILFCQHYGRKSVKTSGVLLPNCKRGWLGAVFFAIGIMSFVMSITHTSVANALVILSTVSLFAALFSAFFLKEYLSLSTWLVIGVAIIGIIIVFSDRMTTEGSLGMLYALVCACVTGANMTIIRSAEKVHVPTLLAWGGIFVALISFWLMPGFNISFRESALFIIMGGLNAVAFLLLGAAAKKIPSPEVSLFILLETILGPVWVWLVISEIPSESTLLGGAIVISALVLHSLFSLGRQDFRA